MTLEIVKVAAGILVPFSIVFFGIVIGVFKYFLKQFATDIKRELKSLNGKIEKNNARVNQVERDFMLFQAQMPKEYVLRADHIRITAIFEKKVDGLVVLIMKLDGTIQGQKAELKLLLSRIGDTNARTEEQDS